MCTLSFWPFAGGYLLLHSRDERRARAAGEPPRALVDARRPTLAPRDGEARGTWLALDADGRSLCVLNGPEEDAPPPVSPRSRGLLALELARDLRRDSCAKELMQGLRRAEYRPFLLAHVELDPTQEEASLALWRWNGRSLREERYSAEHLEISSTASYSEAERHRRERFEALTAALRQAEPRRARRSLWAFHHEHRAEAPAGDGMSPCMHRSEAATQGLHLVEVRRSRTLLFHRPGSPCARAAIEAHRAFPRSTSTNGDWTSHRPAR
ncbi:MAG: NRDE family protein [Planctomycetes bacterium]|nr:NRDE family protein [Planctomycetota bacterium]